jgi:hypothetical protein
MINVIFKVEPGAGRSSVSTETMLKLFETCPAHRVSPGWGPEILIAGRRIQAMESMDFYEELNILGADFLTLANSRLSIDYS